MDEKQNRIERENHALDALIASFHVFEDYPDDIPLDDPSILTEEDRKALEALGYDLIDRLVAQRGSIKPPSHQG